MRETVLNTVVPINILSTMDSFKKVTGNRSCLDFQNKPITDDTKETDILKLSLPVPKSQLTSLLSFPMHAKYHLPSCTTVCVCVCITSYLQKSNYPKVK